MTNKEFIDYMQVCGKLKLTEEIACNNNMKINLDIFNNSSKEVWKYWILLESIEMDKANILYAMRIMIEQNLNESDIKELIENMRLLSRIAVISWHDICRKFEENIISYGKVNEITVCDKDGVYLIIDDECIDIEWQENTLDKVNIRVENKLYKDIEKLLIENEVKFKTLKEGCSTNKTGLYIKFKKVNRYGK